MGNPWRGDVVLVIDGQSHVMRLTLGALAELEAGLETGSLVELVQRFESGGFGTRDVLSLIVAGLRGGGWQGEAGDLLSAEIAGGPMAAARAAAELLARAFMLPDTVDDGFDWPALMRAGMRGLGLKPWEFWALTPAELQMMLGEGGCAKPMGRARLSELMAAFPDDKRGDGA